MFDCNGNNCNKQGWEEISTKTKCREALRKGLEFGKYTKGIKDIGDVRFIGYCPECKAKEAQSLGIVSMDVENRDTTWDRLTQEDGNYTWRK